MMGEHDTHDREARLQALLDRQEIFDCLVRYCRGVDRLDAELLASAYHPDAIDDHGIYVGRPHQFADYFLAFHEKNQTATQHVITNHSCELDGDTASGSIGDVRQGRRWLVGGGSPRIGIAFSVGAPGRTISMRARSAAAPRGRESWAACDHW